MSIERRFNDWITVRYKGMDLNVSTEVANLMGLRSGQQLQTEEEFWEVLRANAQHGIARCRQMIEAKSNLN